MFDPEEHKPSSERRDEDHPRLDKPGRFLVACKYVPDHYEESKNGNPFVRCYFHVIAGPNKDHWFREDVFVHAKAYGRLGSLAAAVGWRKKFDPATDLKSLADLLLHRPFVAKVKVEQGNDGKRYARIAFFDPVIGEEIKIAKAYQASIKDEREEQMTKLREAIDRKAEQRQRDRDDFADDPSPRGGSRSYEESFDDDFEDEIPFVVNAIEHGDPRERSFDPCRFART